MTHAVFQAVGRYRRPFENVLFAIGILAVIAVFCHAIVLRVATPRVPVADPDTWGYLFPALSALDGQGLVQKHARDWLYPAFLAACLGLGSFSVITAVQQTLGILAGVFFLGTAILWCRLLPGLRVLRACALIFVSGFLWIFLCNPQTVLFETEIRPEAVMNIAIFAQLFCVLQFVHARWRGGTRRASVVWGALAIFFAYTAYLLKPSWALAVPATCLPVALGVFHGWRIRISGLVPIALAAGLIVAVFVVPKKLFFVPESTAPTFLPMVLFAIHADLINAHLHAATAPQDAAGREFLEMFDRELAKARAIEHNYETLGFDPDFLMFKSPFFHHVKVHAGGTNDAFRSWCLREYAAAFRANPGGYFRKVALQMGHFFDMKESTIYRHRIDWQKEWRSSAESLPADAAPQFSEGLTPLIENYRSAMAPLAEIPAEAQGPGLLRQWVRHIVNSLSVWEVLFTVALIASIGWRPLRPLWPAGCMAVVLLSAPLGNALTVAIIHALDISRYRYSYGPPLLLAIFAMIVFTVVVAAFAAAGLSRKYRSQIKSV